MPDTNSSGSGGTKRQAPARLLPHARLGEVRAWLESHVTHEGHDCLIFPYCRTPQGYGSVQVGGRSMRAHQWICKAAHGEHPKGKPFALHRCGNGHLGCVNPNHLYWGDSAQNYRDQVADGVAAKGERNGRSTLTEAQVIAIKAMARDGKKHREIAATVQAQAEAVRSVLRGRTWAWL